MRLYVDNLQKLVTQCHKLYVYLLVIHIIYATGQ